MVRGLTILVIVAYAVAAFSLWRDRSFRPFLLLFAGSIATLAQPIWARLYGNSTNLPGQMLRLGNNFTLPVWTVLGGGVLLALPPLLIAYGLRHRWWGRHYAANWTFFGVFVLFFLILDAVGLRSRMEVFARPEVPNGGLPESLLHILLLAGVSFGLLYSFVATRHYALRIALIPVLLSGLAAAVLFNGILASPYWVTRFLRDRTTFTLSPRLGLAGAVVAMLLILWGIHLLASGMHAGRRQQLNWR